MLHYGIILNTCRVQKDMNIEYYSRDCWINNIYCYSQIDYDGSQEKNVSASLAIFIYLLEVPDKLIFPKKEWSGVKHQLRIAVTDFVFRLKTDLFPFSLF